MEEQKSEYPIGVVGSEKALGRREKMGIRGRCRRGLVHFSSHVSAFVKPEHCFAHYPPRFAFDPSLLVRLD